MASSFHFELHTPSHLFFSGPVQSVILTVTDGDMEIQAGHCMCTAPVKTGVLRIKNDEGAWRAAFLTGGILEVTEHKTVILSDNAEWGKDIDRERALKAKERAIEFHGKSMVKYEIENAAASLRRAECRLKAWELENNGGKNDTIRN